MLKKSMPGIEPGTFGYGVRGRYQYNVKKKVLKKIPSRESYPELGEMEHVVSTRMTATTLI